MSELTEYASFVLLAEAAYADLIKHGKLLEGNDIEDTLIASKMAGKHQVKLVTEYGDVIGHWK